MSVFDDGHLVRLENELLIVGGWDKLETGGALRAHCGRSGYLKTAADAYLL